MYALHRETFYLAQDFFDRFMLTQKNINKSMLQLIGITSLFIASKLEVRHKEEDITFEVTEGSGNIYFFCLNLLNLVAHTQHCRSEGEILFLFLRLCVYQSLRAQSLSSLSSAAGRETT